MRAANEGRWEGSKGSREEGAGGGERRKEEKERRGRENK